MSRPDGSRLPAAAPRRAARNLVAVLLAVLCTIFVAWHLSRFSLPTALLASALGVGPWLAAAPGLWRGEPRRYAVATLLTAPYLAYGLMEMLANAGARGYAAALVLAAFGLFVALTAYLRINRRRAAVPT